MIIIRVTLTFFVFLSSFFQACFCPWRIWSKGQRSVPFLLFLQPIYNTNIQIDRTDQHSIFLLSSFSLFTRIKSEYCYLLKAPTPIRLFLVNDFFPLLPGPIRIPQRLTLHPPSKFQLRYNTLLLSFTGKSLSQFCQIKQGSPLRQTLYINRYMHLSFALNGKLPFGKR